MKQMHEIKFTHDWKHSKPSKSDRASYVSVQTCIDCGSNQSILHLGTKPREPNLVELVSGTDSQRQKANEYVRELSKSCTRLIESLAELSAQIFDRTRYNDIDDFARQINQLYHKAVKEYDISYEMAQHFLRASHGGKKIRRKVLLALKQGLVCNRCDRAFYSIRQLTEDHIVPKSRGGQSELSNLQLLCQPCNQFKKAGEPGELDISPYTYNGNQCIHEIPCGIVDLMRVNQTKGFGSGG